MINLFHNLRFLNLNCFQWDLPGFNHEWRSLVGCATHQQTLSSLALCRLRRGSRRARTKHRCTARSLCSSNSSVSRSLFLPRRETVRRLSSVRLLRQNGDSLSRGNLELTILFLDYITQPSCFVSYGTV